MGREESDVGRTAADKDSMKNKNTLKVYNRLYSWNSILRNPILLNYRFNEQILTFPQIPTLHAFMNTKYHNNIDRQLDLTKHAHKKLM